MVFVMDGTYPSSHYLNSTILFCQPDSDIQAGVIQNIFEYSFSTSNLGGQVASEKDYFLTLHVYVPVNRAGFYDPYHPFGLAAGYLCNSKPIGIVVIKLS